MRLPYLFIGQIIILSSCQIGLFGYSLIVLLMTAGQDFEIGQISYGAKNLLKDESIFWINIQECVLNFLAGYGRFECSRE